MWFGLFKGDLKMNHSKYCKAMKTGFDASCDCGVYKDKTEEIIKNYKLDKNLPIGVRLFIRELKAENERLVSKLVKLECDDIIFRNKLLEKAGLVRWQIPFITEEKPRRNQSVWIYVNDGKCYIQCKIIDLTGWHLGWWSGTRWHSLMDESIRDKSELVKGWLPLNLPYIKRNSDRKTEDNNG